MKNLIETTKLDKTIFQRPKFEEVIKEDLIFWGQDVLHRDQFIHKSAYIPLKNMIKMAAKDNIILEVLSIFRSYKYQENLI
ncbi:hypothetical protein LO80_07780 [Candidatus Francisella endociliophora]|uniref:Uncharacterized protein n=1 Tax=Candidatus Francisella endociliophora TaxID=653937 RepID=A0A097EQN1_9GAMM|nr:D-alanyl-D-alanine carboxypeptidase family protein [Francisella sp. FSC1006]AIT09879.1 hypothetical protein LO80_07780 [Francisella sp. FSC1006]